MAQQKTRIGMPLDEYIRRYDEEGPFEIIDGKIVPMSPAMFGHSYLTRLVFLAFYNFVLPERVWEVFSETPFIQPDRDDANWVEGSLVPDVMLVRAERIAAYKAATPDWRERPLPVVPDLVVEIVSENDRYRALHRKIERYFKLGVQVAWLMDEARKKVTIHENGSEQQTTLGPDGTLTCEKLLPGFKLAVQTLFEG